MALWIRDGFELYNALADMTVGSGYGVWNSLSNTGNSLGGFSSNTRFGVGRSINLNGNLGAGGSLTKSGFANSATVFAGLAYLPNASPTTGGCIVEFLDGGTVQVTFQWVSNAIKVFCGGTGGTLLGTFSSAFINGQWNQYQLKVVINSTTGEIHIRKNGNSVDDFALTGVNTQNSANPQANAVVLNGPNNAAGGGATPCFVDDFAAWSGISDGTVWDDWVGDFRIVAMPPISDNSVQFAQNNAGSTTFGSTNVTGSHARAANQIVLFPVTPSCGGSLGSLTLTLTSGFTGNMQCALYDSDGDNASWDSTPTSLTQPGTLLFQTNPVVNPVTGANVFTWTATPFVQNRHKYYLAVWSDTVYTEQDNNSSGTGPWAVTLAYGSFPATLQNTGAAATTFIGSLNCTITPTNSGMVNDYTQDGSTTYLTDSNVGDVDLYNLLGLTFTPSSILGVDVVAVVSKSDSGGRGLTPQLQSGVTTQSYTQIVPNTTFNWFRYQQDTDPNTGLAWTPIALNSALLGQKLTL